MNRTTTNENEDDYFRWKYCDTTDGIDERAPACRESRQAGRGWLPNLIRVRPFNPRYFLGRYTKSRPDASGRLLV